MSNKLGILRVVRKQIYRKQITRVKSRILLTPISSCSILNTTVKGRQALSLRLEMIFDGKIGNNQASQPLKSGSKNAKQY